MGKVVGSVSNNHTDDKHTNKMKLSMVVNALNLPKENYAQLKK